ncbi:hypothetical protein PMIN07_005369 [Paraphaeosphaeria minitans]
MKLSFILLAVLAAVAWATPLQQAGVKEIQQGYEVEHRQTIPPEKPDRCYVCDRVYLDCMAHCYVPSKECQLECRIEACDYEDCHRNCGWTGCSQKKALQVNAQQDGAQQTEAQQEPSVEERSPVAQHSDKPSNNPCEKCDKKFDSCMNDWWCWFHKDVCFKDCRVEVCEEIEQENCEVRKQTTAFRENHGKNTTQQAPNEETTEKQETDGDLDNRILACERSRS